MTDADDGRPAHLRPAKLRRAAPTAESPAVYDAETVHEQLDAVIDAIVELRDRISSLEQVVRDLTDMVDVTSDAVSAQIRNALEHLEPAAAAEASSARRAARRARRLSADAAGEPAAFGRQRQHPDGDQ